MRKKTVGERAAQLAAMNVGNIVHRVREQRTAAAGLDELGGRAR